MAKETVVCSQKVADAIRAFNNCDSYDEQLEVVDLLCDVMWKTTYRAIMENYVKKGVNDEYEKQILQLKQELHDYKIRCGELTSMLDEAHYDRTEQDNFIQSLKSLPKKRAYKGALIIINNIKHYLGDKWDTLFPNGMDGVNRYIETVDPNHTIFGTDTWSQYEEKVK